MLQCGVLQCGVLQCGVLQCVVLQCVVLQCVVISTTLCNGTNDKSYENIADEGGMRFAFEACLR